jgi:SAM-dependent methyltransferase
MKKILLDVGCGNNPKGDVNCDLFLGETPHIMIQHRIDAKKIPNFVLCDAMHLSFRDKSFDIVNASQVLEHVINPAFLLSEMKRISRETVTLDVPNLRRLTPEENPHHIYSWSALTLKNLLALFFKDIVILPSGYQGYLPESLLKRKFVGPPFKLLESFIEKFFGAPFLRAICRI